MQCGDLHGWNGRGNGREVQEEGDICMHRAEGLGLEARGAAEQHHRGRKHETHWGEVIGGMMAGNVAKMVKDG